MNFGQLTSHIKSVPIRMNFGQLTSHIKPVPIRIKNTSLRYIKSFRRQVLILVKSHKDEIPPFFDIPYQRRNYIISM